MPFGATGVFELSYQLTGSVLQPWAFHALYPYWILWTAIGFAGIGYFGVGRWLWVVVASYLAGFLLWGATGFEQVEWGTPAQYPVAYAFNIPLKIAAFAMFGLLMHYGTSVPDLTTTTSAAASQVPVMAGLR